MQKVCIVVPCYNEARRLPGADFLAFLHASPDAELCFVDDGSVDATVDVLRALQAKEPQRIQVHCLARNAGKAAAVRAGVIKAAASARFRLIGYWDADLSTPLDEVEHLVGALGTDASCVLALGSRVKRLGSTIERRAVRHVLGRVFAGCASGLLGVSVYDSQCGAKVFRSAAVPILFADPFVTRWLFDLEMLVRLRNRMGSAFPAASIEVPLRCWREVSGSKLKPRDIATVPIELLAIRSHYKQP